LAAAQATADLTLRYRPQAEVDRMCFDLWTRELAVDGAAEDAGTVAGDVATLEWLRDPLVFSATDTESVDDQLRHLRAAADAHDMTSAANAADQLRETTAKLAQK
jgi:hypothetical protein